MVLPHKKSIGQKVTTLLVFQAYIIVKIDPALHSTKVTKCHIANISKISVLFHLFEWTIGSRYFWFNVFDIFF